MQLIGAIDLRRGVAVAGKAGERQNYRPIVSPLCSSADPLAIAGAYRDVYGITSIYLADLDAIAGSKPAVELLGPLIESGFELLVDAGFRTAEDADRMIAIGVHRVIAATESIRDPGILREMVSAFGADRIVASIDIKQGRVVANSGNWPIDPERAVGVVADCGCVHTLLLEISRVGTQIGIGIGPLLFHLRRHRPDAAVYLGGGVRDHRDLDEAQRHGVSGIILGTALHRRNIAPDRIRGGCWGQAAETVGDDNGVRHASHLL